MTLRLGSPLPVQGRWRAPWLAELSFRAGCWARRLPLVLLLACLGYGAAVLQPRLLPAVSTVEARLLIATETGDPAEALAIFRQLRRRLSSDESLSAEDAIPAQNPASDFPAQSGHRPVTDFTARVQSGGSVEAMLTVSASNPEEALATAATYLDRILGPALSASQLRELEQRFDDTVLALRAHEARLREFREVHADTLPEGLGYLRLQKKTLRNRLDRISHLIADIVRQRQGLDKADATLVESGTEAALKVARAPYDARIAGLAEQQSHIESRLGDIRRREARMPATARQAKRLESRLADLGDRYERLRRALNSARAASHVRVALQPRLRRPNPPRITFGLGCGLLAGLLVAVALERGDRRVRSARDIERKLGNAPIAVLSRDATASGTGGQAARRSALRGAMAAGAVAVIVGFALLGVPVAG